MKWNALSKEKKQVAALAALLSITLVYVLVSLVILPFMRNLGRTHGELAALQADLRKADTRLAAELRHQEEFDRLTAFLKEADERYLPTVGNPLAWATAVVYHRARGEGIELEGVSEEPGGTPPWSRSRGSERHLDTFIIKLSMTGGYQDIVQLMEALERGNPYLCIKAFSMQPTDDVERHRVTLDVEWPLWQVPGGAEAARAALLADAEQAGSARRK